MFYWTLTKYWKYYYKNICIKVFQTDCKSIATDIAILDHLDLLLTKTDANDYHQRYPNGDDLWG